jgi:hypothetical protein
MHEEEAANVNTLPVVESQKALEVVELHSFVGRMAREEQVIPWLYHPSKAHEQRTVYAHGCNPEKNWLAEELQAMWMPDTYQSNTEKQHFVK